MPPAPLAHTPIEGLDGGRSSRGAVHVLSVDVEDIVVAATDLYGKEPPVGYRDSIENDLRRTLDVLDAANARATFFMNARYCDDHDAVVREVVARGHRLASHGYRHSDVRELSIEGFRDDLVRSLEVLRRYQDDVIGYRPPAFTMPFDDAHMRVLLDHGIRYVSCGALVTRTNVPRVEAPVRLHNGLFYVPVSIWYLWGGKLRYPVGYGHTSRLMPEDLCVGLVKRFIERRGFFQFYFHPYEVPGITREQKRALYGVHRDVGFRIYSQRSHDRTSLFTRIASAGHFEPIESIRSVFND
jgi:hypothetical protein